MLPLQVKRSSRPKHPPPQAFPKETQAIILGTAQADTSSGQNGCGCAEDSILLMCDTHRGHIPARCCWGHCWLLAHGSSFTSHEYAKDFYSQPSCTALSTPENHRVMESFGLERTCEIRSCQHLALPSPPLYCVTASG